MAKNFRPVVREEPQSHNSIRGRGASWSPANRFEKLHVDLTDLDVVDVDLETEERPRRETQYLRDDTKSVITRNNSPDVGFESSPSRFTMKPTSTFVLKRVQKVKIRDLHLAARTGVEPVYQP